MICPSEAILVKQGLTRIFRMILRWMLCGIVILSLSMGLDLGGVSGLSARAAGIVQDHLDTAEVIRVWQHRIERNPAGQIRYLYLSEALLQRGRETGDVSYFLQAETAARTALDLDPQYRDAEALLAQILYSLHEFQAALDLAEPLAQAGSIRALATLGDVHLALGHYVEAEAAYQQWADLKPISSGWLSRRAALAEILGDPDMALDLLTQAIESAKANGETGESLAWLEHQIGLLQFTIGQIDEAADHFQRSIEIYPDYYLGLAGLGRIHAAQGDLETAIDLYRQATEQIPQPDLLATLGDLYTLSGQPDQAESCFATVDLIATLAQIQQQIYNRQLVYVWADHDRHLDQALDLAVAELAFRKDVLGWDVAAWAYFKNGLIDQAQQAIEQAMQFKTQNPLIYYHAGLIAQAQGRISDAQALLSQALVLNPHFDPRQSQRARMALAEVAEGSEAAKDLNVE